MKGFIPLWADVGQTHIGRWAWFYHLLIFAWIFFGLGYLVMVINIITKGFRSRPVVSLEKKMAAHIRATRTKMAKDAQLLRQLVNQIRILKIKVRAQHVVFSMLILFKVEKNETTEDEGAFLSLFTRATTAKCDALEVNRRPFPTKKRSTTI